MLPKQSSAASAWRRGLAAAAIASLLAGCLVDSASADAEAAHAALHVVALPPAAVTPAAQAAVAAIHADAQPDQIDRALTEQAFASGAVKADDKLTATIDDGKEPTTLAPLMARLKRQP